MPAVSNRNRKLQRTTAQRGALIRSLAIALIENRSIETTMPKAKTLRPYVEKLVTKAKIGDLHNRRLIIARLHSVKAAGILVDDIAPKLKDRDSGCLRIKHSTLRRGDNAQLATISFVDDTTVKVEPVTRKEKKVEKKAVKAEKKAEAKKPAKKASKKTEEK